MMNLLKKYRPVLAPDGVGGGGSSPAPGPSDGGSPGGTSQSPSEGGAAPSAPSPSGASAAPSTSAPSGGAAPDFDFSAMFGTESPGLESFSSPPAPAGVPAAEPPAPPVAEPPPAAAPAEASVPPAAEPGAVAPTPAPGAPDQGTPPAPPTAAQIDPYDPAALAGHLASNEAQATAFVAEQMFQLSREEAEALEQDVIGTVPKLLAKVFVKSQQNVLSQLGRMIPVMVQRQTLAMQRNEDGVSKFYKRWPDIKKDQHNELVNKYATVYRQMHPDTTLDQMIEDLGPMVMMAARIVPSPSPGALAGRTSGQAGAPTSANGRPPQPSPFVPASSGPVAQSPAVEKHPWEVMFENG